MMARKWNPEIPTNREDVIAVLRELDLDNVQLYESGQGNSSDLQEMQDLLPTDPWRQDPTLNNAQEEFLDGVAQGMREFLDAMPEEVDLGDRLYYIHLDVASAIDTRNRIKPVAAKQGLFPVFCGDADYRVGMSFHDRPHKVLAAAEGLEASDQAAQWYDGRKTLESREPDCSWLMGDWPMGIPSRDTPYLHGISRRDENSRVPLLFLPGTDMIDALSRLLYHQPPTELIIAYVRQWQRRYGVDLISLTRNSMEFRAERQPCTRDDATRLARECMLLCPDLLSQMNDALGFECDSIPKLAAHLMCSKYWLFWWD